MAYYDQYYTRYPQVQTPFTEVKARRAPGDAVEQRMNLILICVLLLIPAFFLTLRPRNLAGTVETLTHSEVNLAQTANGVGEKQVSPLAAPAGAAAETLAPLFTREVMHWAPQIVEWANTYGLDPNLVAIIMQIESCGDPQAVSSAGAQGLFQVMPFHFAAGEDAFDPDTNARRGLSYYADRLNQTGGDIGLAFAGYNGGQQAAASGWDSWPDETQRYFIWSTGIYNDIHAGSSESATLQEWLGAGGADLCRQAAQRLSLQ